MTTITEKRMDEIMAGCCGRRDFSGRFRAGWWRGLPCTSPRAGYEYRVFQGEPEELRTVTGISMRRCTAWKRLIQLGF